MVCVRGELHGRICSCGGRRPIKGYSKKSLLNLGQVGLEVVDDDLSCLVDLHKREPLEKELVLLDGLEVAITVGEEQNQEILAQLVSESRTLSKVGDKDLLLCLVKRQVKQLAGLGLGSGSCLWAWLIHTKEAKRESEEKPTCETNLKNPAQELVPEMTVGPLEMG